MIVSQRTRIVAHLGALLPFWSVVAILLTLLASGCGYHTGRGGTNQSRQTVSVPYITGDLTGYATASLVHQLASQGQYRYAHGDGILTLQVELVDQRTDHIGFRYEVSDDGDLEDNVIAAEDRLSVLAKVSLVDSETNAVVLGPKLVSASVDYDYQTDPIRANLTQFSAGQFDVFESAEDAALHALYDALANKIVTFLNNT